MSKVSSVLVSLALVAGAAYLILAGGQRSLVTGVGGSGSGPETIAGLSATTLKGETVALESLAGKPMLLDFWATWCPPCIEQRRELEALTKELGDKVRVVALSVDDSPAIVQGFLARSPAMPHELMASPEIARAFNVQAIPLLVVVDSTGKVRKVARGRHTAAELKEMLAGL
ncbi:MAG: TlpA family protein disulfide reductase [Phycisphaerales bacterium]|nr:TlpA family protein disulfide reductase [Phycisphaerales bacterium]